MGAISVTLAMRRRHFLHLDCNAMFIALPLRLRRSRERSSANPFSRAPAERPPEVVAPGAPEPGGHPN
jgi:hypothetical protein